MNTQSKVQAVDNFAKYLDKKDKSIYSILVLPVVKKRIPKDINLKMVSAQIRKNMLEDAGKNNGKITVGGKPRYYPAGNWSNPQEPYSYITFDLWGKDADILKPGVIELRINSYFNMQHETNLKTSMEKLHIDVRSATSSEDSNKKVDLIAYVKNKSIGISIYKSTDKTALHKLRGKNANQFDVRIAYNIYKYGKPSNIKNVKKWWNDCKQGKNIITIKSDDLKYIS